MKVLDMLTKINALKALRDDLDKRSNDDNILGEDSDLMSEASGAISEYIRELHNKEVKV